VTFFTEAVGRTQTSYSTPDNQNAHDRFLFSSSKPTGCPLAVNPAGMDKPYISVLRRGTPPLPIVMKKLKVTA
jgi:hypothetical protein